MANLYLLHGALGASSQFSSLISNLRTTGIQAQALDFSGHGNRASETEVPFGIEPFARQVLSEMEISTNDKVDLFGYSMGGYVALWLAANYPEKIGKVMTLATKFAWSEEAAEKECRMLSPAKIEEKVPAFAAQLAAMHGAENWMRVVTNTAQLMRSLGAKQPLGTEDFARIQIPVQLMVGDRDAMVSLQETETCFRQLSDGRLGVLPETKHPLEKVSVERLSFEFINFFR